MTKPANRKTVEIPAEQNTTTSLTWTESFAARTAYERAVGCLEDALLVARERERHGLAALVNDALGNVQCIGRIYNIANKDRP